MDIKEWEQKIPAIKRTKEEGGASGVSKHYQFMTTHEVIGILSTMGWVIYDGRAQKSKNNAETTKHMLRFRNEKYGSLGLKGNIPEILFVNSHDRSSSLNFHVGIFNVIRGNSWVVADKTFDEFKIRHMGTSFDQIKIVIDSITKGLPKVFTAINRFEGITLNKNEEIEFAMSSLAIRFPEYVDVKTNKVKPELINKSMDINEVLEAMRPEDNKHDLWTVGNKIQEHIIKGGFDRIGTLGNKPIAVRELTNIRMNIIVSRGIWGLMGKHAEFSE